MVHLSHCVNQVTHEFSHLSSNFASFVTALFIFKWNSPTVLSLHARRMSWMICVTASGAGGKLKGDEERCRLDWTNSHISFSIRVARTPGCPVFHSNGRKPIKNWLQSSAVSAQMFTTCRTYVAIICVYFRFFENF